MTNHIILSILLLNQKQRVVEFKPWKKIPYCQLRVSLDKDRKHVKLKYKVKLYWKSKVLMTFSSLSAQLKVEIVLAL